MSLAFFDVTMLRCEGVCVCVKVCVCVCVYVLLVFFDITMQSSQLGWGTIQSCLFRYNNAAFYVGMGNGSVLSFLMQQCRVRCWDGERFSLVFFDITMQSSLLGTLQCVCVCHCVYVWKGYSHTQRGAPSNFRVCSSVLSFSR